jgi:hypothetical protein
MSLFSCLECAQEPCICSPDSKVIEKPFPVEYRAPGTWGWSEQDATELHEYFIGEKICHLSNPYNGSLLKTMSVSYTTRPESSQVLGGYYNPNLEAEEEDHCIGKVLPSSDAPECIRKLQMVLQEIVRKMPGYETRSLNYLSVMHYPDENAGINWHKHGEDNGCDTPVLLVATGEVRDLFLGKQKRGRKLSDGPDEFWRKPMQHGSLVIMSDEMNYTHWHAILTNTKQNRDRYGVPDVAYGPRISINTKCVLPPSVFPLNGRHPRWGVYVGCAGTQRSCPCHKGIDGTVYGNSYRPLDVDGHKNAMASNTEAGFREYAEKKMLDPAFRAQAIEDLKGKHLLCWKHDGWCHARVWLDIVNRPGGDK